MIKISELESTAIFSKEFIKQKQTKNRLLLLLSYLKINSPLNGNIGVSINLLAEKIGYLPDSHKNRINSKIIESISWLKEHEHIITEVQNTGENKNKFTDIRSTDCFIIHINENSDLFYPKDKYVVLTETEFITIVQSVSACDKQDLLNVFLNIKKFMSFGKDDRQICYPSHTTLCKDCHISSTGAMNNIINDLISIGLLYTYNSGKYKDKNGNVKYANNFYALDDKTLNSELCDDIIKGYYSIQGVTINEFIKDNI